MQNLKVRTGYSFRTAYGRLDEVAQRLPEGTRAAITDRGSTFGHNLWSKMHDDPIFGVELAVVPDLGMKKPPTNYMTFLATDSLMPLYELVGVATEQFYYVPRLTYEQVVEASKDLIVFIGSRPDVSRIVANENTFLDLSPATPRGLEAWAREHGFPAIASSENFYPTAEDRYVYEVLTGRNATSQTYPLHLMTEQEWMNECGGNEAAIQLGYEIAKRCTAKLEQAEIVTPPRPDTLQNLCKKGALTKGINLEDPIYAERLERELSVIAEKNFEDYFYIISDLLVFSKKHMFVGPARGSSCGSLVCYLMDITEVDPIKHGLIFERFIDLNRADLPDIDIDFSDDRRELALNYLTETYGADRTARLGSVSIYKPKVILNEATSALSIPAWKANKVKDSVEKNLAEAFETNDDGQSLIKDFPELWVAPLMEGHPRHAGQHAAGIVVTKDPVSKYAAKDNRTGALMVDKTDAEDLNLLKIDCLGLVQLAVFDDCLEMAGKDRDWLKSYPLDDKDVLKLARDGKFTGVFQFQGGAVQSLASQVKITEFNDLVALTALARPGPLNSGGAQQWVDRKAGTKPVEFFHPTLEPILKDTLGVLIYQEQVMRICRDVGQMSWPDVSSVRRIIGKSKGREALAEYEEIFVQGAQLSGMTEEEAREVWSQIVTHGQYSFNLSHSVAYSFITYWCFVLKKHFPLFFSAATLRREGDEANQLRLLRELAEEGVQYVPFDADRSTDKWEVDGNSLIGPLTGVKGIGPKMAETIMGMRERGEAYPERVVKLIGQASTGYDNLYPIKKKWPGLYKVPGPFKLTEPLTNLDSIPQGKDTFVRVVGEVLEIENRDHNEKSALERRGYEMKSPTKWMAVKIKDDTETFYCQVNRYDYERFGKEIESKGIGAIWLFAGKVGKDFRRLSIKKMKYIGKM